VTKSDTEIVEILEAYDLTGTVWSAVALTGHDPKTVKRYVEARNGGRNPYEREPRPKIIDAFLEKVEEWAEQSTATIRADVVHDKLVKMGYQGSERSTRRAVNTAKTAWKAGKRRTYHPWIPEPNRWLQFRLGRGAAHRGASDLAVLRMAVLVAVPGGDPGLGLHAGHFGGLPGHHAPADRRAPTYVLTDNAKTVTVEHIAGIPVRHPQMVAAGRHYGCQVVSCVPYDPESKGGAEATVRIAKADLVPTDANLLAAYDTLAELADACHEAVPTPAPLAGPPQRTHHDERDKHPTRAGRAPATSSRSTDRPRPRRLLNHRSHQMSGSSPRSSGCRTDRRASGTGRGLGLHQLGPPGLHRTDQVG